MTYDQYNKKKDELIVTHQNNIRELQNEFALSNNTVILNDIVEDSLGKIKVEKIGLYVSWDKPECVYLGTEYKKDNTPTKKKANREVYQENLKSINDVPLTKTP